MTDRMEEFDRKLNRLTDIVTVIGEQTLKNANGLEDLTNRVTDLARLQAQNAELNQRAFQAIQEEFREVRQLIDSNARAIQALADNQGG